MITQGAMGKLEAVIGSPNAIGLTHLPPATTSISKHYTQDGATINTLEETSSE